MCFIFFKQKTPLFNRDIQINFVDVPSTDVRSEEEPSHNIYPDRQTNVNVAHI